MHSSSSCLLCQPTDGIFHFFGCGHHQVCQLINRNDNLRQRLPVGLTLDFLVIVCQIPYPVVRKGLVTVFHLLYRPVQCTSCLFRVSDNRNQQVGNVLIHSKFYNFRVNQNQPHLFRCRMKQNTHDDGIGADRFTRTCCTGDNQMRHFCNVANNRISGDVLSNCKRQLTFCSLERIGFENISQFYHIFFPIRDFNPYD